MLDCLYGTEVPVHSFVAASSLKLLLLMSLSQVMSGLEEADELELELSAYDDEDSGVNEKEGRIGEVDAVLLGLILLLKLLCDCGIIGVSHPWNRQKSPIESLTDCEQREYWCF